MGWTSAAESCWFSSDHKTSLLEFKSVVNDILNLNVVSQNKTYLITSILIQKSYMSYKVLRKDSKAFGSDTLNVGTRYIFMK